METIYIKDAKVPVDCSTPCCVLIQFSTKCAVIENVPSNILLVLNFKEILIPAIQHILEEMVHKERQISVSQTRIMLHLQIMDGLEKKILALMREFFHQ